MLAPPPPLTPFPRIGLAVIEIEDNAIVYSDKCDSISEDERALDASRLGTIEECRENERLRELLIQVRSSTAALSGTRPIRPACPDALRRRV